MSIPHKVLTWFEQKRWQLHDYQQAMFQLYNQHRSVLLIAPTGGGKTLASFLPSLIAIDAEQPQKLHTLYISPLKALTYDIAHNLQAPIAEMQLKISVASRTGDTSAKERQQLRKKPSQILLTTPESLLLLLTYPEAKAFFSDLKTVIIDELHQFMSGKRGDLTALALAQLTTIAQPIKIGLSATIANPDYVAKWLGGAKAPAEVINVAPKFRPEVNLLNSQQIPYTGIMAKYALPALYTALKDVSMCLIFVNTRAQAEFIFNELWQINEKNWPIAIYHGSLDKSQREKTTQMILNQQVKAVVATSALELGIDWQQVDLVVQVGPPKGISRLLQRVGRSNHFYQGRSKAILVPANCFELLECAAAIQAIDAYQLDNAPLESGALDVIVQFIVNCACSQPITAAKIYQIVKSAYPYQKLSKAIFQQLFNFAVNGGYVLQHYDRYQRLKLVRHNTYAIASPRVLRRHRQNIGTIISNAHIKIVLKQGKRNKVLGEVEEAFIQQLTPGDNFLFAGQQVSFVMLRDMSAYVTRAKAGKLTLPSYAGGTMPLSTHLADGVSHLIQTPELWVKLPQKIQQWLNLQKQYSMLPGKNFLLIESFRYRRLQQTVLYTFAGRVANYSLAHIISYHMEQQGLKPTAFTITDYGIAIASLKIANANFFQAIFTLETLTKDIESWLEHSSMQKRIFRRVAIITGLIEKQIAGTKKSLRQVTFSTDLIYDVLKKHENQHILLAITRQETEQTLLAYSELQQIIRRFQKHYVWQALEKPSPMSLPILLAIKTEQVAVSALDELLSQASHEAEAIQIMQDLNNENN